MWLWLLITFFIASLIAAVGVFGIIYRERAGVATTDAHLKGKTVLITGATSGIGKEAAKLLAKKGARLILACRNMAKAENVADEIRSMTGSNEEVIAMELDTSSLASVRKFAHEFREHEKRLDILVLNAGMFATLNHQKTQEGLDLTMATNYLGHFLLANLLLGVMLLSRPCRIIVTSSGLHRFCKKLDPANLNFQDGDFSQFQAYSRSKACGVLFTRQLAVITEGTGITVNAFCPGLVATDIFKKTEGFLVGTLERNLAPFIGRTLWQGAQPIIHLAASETLNDTTGKFFEDCKVTETTWTSDTNMELAKQLWDESVKIVNLAPEERYL